jgi:hypothetical protein
MSDKIKSVLLIVALIVVVTVLVTTTALGEGVAKPNRQAERVAPLMPKVRLGWSEGRVQALLGRPAEDQSSTTFGAGTEVWIYGLPSGDGSWQLVFHDNQLTAKNL